MENRSFDHFLGWLPHADGRHDLEFTAPDGNVYRNYPRPPTSRATAKAARTTTTR